MSDTIEFDAKTLTNDQLYRCIEELRNRGAAIAVYDADGLSEGPANLEDNEDVQPEHYVAYMTECREEIEDVMCQAVWKHCQNIELVNGKLEHV